MATEGRPAVVLLSGGLDSATALAVARRDGFACHALTVAYGQRHDVEREAARRVAQALGAASHREMALDLRAFGGSALTADVPVPRDRAEAEMAAGVPATYVPARNTIFLSLSLALAEVMEAFDIFIGVNAVDYSVAEDTRVWVRSSGRPTRMTIGAFHRLPPGDYETLAVDPRSLQLGWRRVMGRARHPALHKRCYRLRLERGQEITITEDHSLFTIDPETCRLATIPGRQVRVGTPIVVPFDLSGAEAAWSAELESVSLSGLAEACEGLSERRSISESDGWITNGTGRAPLPVTFPLTDELLYIIGLWLAEGGKDEGSRDGQMAFSVGGVPGAVDALRSYFQPFGVAVRKSPENDFDYSICSSTFAALFRFLGLLGTAKAGTRQFPAFFWSLSQRQRRVVVAGLWDGGGSHVFNHQATLAQRSHQLVRDCYDCLLLDNIFPHVEVGPHSQLHLLIGRAADFRRFAELYPLRHESKRTSLAEAGRVAGKDKATGLWKCPGLWRAVSHAELPPGAKTTIYNAGGKYDDGMRAERSAFAEVPELRPLVDSRLAFLAVTEVCETLCAFMYDLSVEGAENFVANGVLAHNSGYPDCRPQFVRAFELVANLGTKAGAEGRWFRVHAPLVDLTKAEIIRLGTSLGVDYGLTHSCYDPGAAGLACGRCDSCLLRRAGFAAAGVADPTRYEPGVTAPP